MSALDIEVVAAHDDAGIAAWADVVRASEGAELGEHATTATAQEQAVLVRDAGSQRRVVLLAGRIGDETVAAGWLSLRLLDNLDGAEIDVHVRPDLRRRGIGSRVLERLEEIAADAGRTRFDTRAQWLYDGPEDGAGVPGMEFARARGYRYGIGEIQRELALPVAAEHLAALAEETAPHHAAYTLRTWSGPVPDDLVAGWLAVSTTLMTEAPAGEVEREDLTTDVMAHREAEAAQARQGRTPWHAVALTAAGEVVAHSMLMVPEHDPVFIHQWGTLVRRDHRGHRLGLALKVANLRRLQDDLDPAGRRVVTWNAEVNGPMVAVNEKLGFVPTARSADLQKILTPSG